MSAALEIILTEGQSTGHGGSPSSARPAPGTQSWQPFSGLSQNQHGNNQGHGYAATSAGMLTVSSLVGDRFRDLISLSPHMRLFSGVLSRGVTDVSTAIRVLQMQQRGGLHAPHAPNMPAARPLGSMTPASAASAAQLRTGNGPTSAPTIPAQLPKVNGPTSAPTIPPVTGAPDVGGSTEAGSALGTLAKVAGVAAIAITGVAAASVGVVKALSMIGEAGRAETERLSGYSGELANATAMAQVADMMRDMKRADKIGPQLAALTAANSRLENALGDMKNAVLEKLLPIAVMAVDGAAERVKILELWMKEAEIKWDELMGNFQEARKDRQELQDIMQELADIKAGVPPGGDPITQLLLDMAKNNDPNGPPRPFHPPKPPAAPAPRIP